jgi:bifunctional DNA-binding transcriptional regulator/antitoxin component of YhaV-PrlF toxin-antitoxin module
VVTITSQETDVEIKQFPIIIGQGGEITIPQLLQDSLNVNQGDMLVLIQIGNLIVLAPKQPQAPQLIDRIATIMENENVSLTDLLSGLEAEREEIWQEKQS